MGSRVAVIAPPSLEAGGSRWQAGTGCGGACPAGRAAGASHVDVGRAATRSTAERLLRTPLVVRSACRLLVVERRMKGLSPALDGSRTRLGPHRRDQRRGPADTQRCKSVADLERDDGDVRGDSVGVEVDGVDAAVVV